MLHAKRIVLEMAISNFLRIIVFVGYMLPANRSAYQFIKTAIINVAAVIKSNSMELNILQQASNILDSEENICL
jgi:hypothetical protein